MKHQFRNTPTLTHGHANRTQPGAAALLTMTISSCLRPLAHPHRQSNSQNRWLSLSHWWGLAAVLFSLAHPLLAGIPDIAVEQPAGTPINNGGSRDFGGVDLGDKKILTYTVRNLGDEKLNLVGVPPVGISGPNAGDFIVTTQALSPIGTGSVVSQGFELPAIDADDPDKFLYRPTSDWVFGGDAGVARNGSPWFVNPAPEGIQAAFLQSKDRRVGIVYRTINFASTGKYLISFSLVRRGNGYEANNIELIEGGVSFGIVEHTSQPDDIWRTFTIPYNCTRAGEHEIIFAGRRDCGDCASALDDVRITPATSFEITFTPTSTGPRSATLTIANDDPDGNPYEINLTGEGVIPPEIAVFTGHSTNAADDLTSNVGTTTFADTLVGGNSLAKTFTIHNYGPGNLTGLALTMSGSSPGDFSLGALAATTLAPNESTTFSVTFTPGTPGVHNAMVNIASNDRNENPFAINVSGTGLGPDIAVFTGNSTAAATERANNLGTHVFVGTAVGSTSTAQTFTVQNKGTASLDGLAVAFVGDNASDFALGALGATTLAPNATTTFTVTFAPTAIGTRNAAVNIASNDDDENPFVIKIRGSDISPEITVEQPAGTTIANGGSRDFTQVPVGYNTTYTFSLRNLGGERLDLTGVPPVVISGPHAGDFWVSTQPSSSIPADGFKIESFEAPIITDPSKFHYGSGGSDWTITGTAGLAQNGSPWFVRPAPEGIQAAFIQSNEGVTGSISRTISFASTGNYLISFSLAQRGQGFEGNDIRVSVDNDRLDTILHTSQDVTWRTFVIPYSCTTPGPHKLEFEGMRTDGGDYASALDDVQVMGGALFDVTFQPTTGGLRTAVLSIASNDPKAKPYEIIITGTGVVDVDDPPTLAPISGPAAIDEDAGLQTINLAEISAGAEESQTLTVTATSGNPSLIPNPTVNYTSPNSTGSLSYTPVANVSGTALITVTVEDDGSNTTTQTFTVTVNPVNDAPTLAPISNPAAINKSSGVQTVQLTGISAGVNESQSLTVTATSGNTSLIPHPTVTYISPNSTGSLSYTPVANASGSALITVTVNDGESVNPSVTQTFVVTVTGTADNVAPVLNTAANPSLVAENEDSPAPIGAVGTLVSSLVEFAKPGALLGNVTDVNTGAVLGIAITGAYTANGDWYYSLNAGKNWSALGAVSDSNARLLVANANNRLYFRPSANFNGNILGALTFRAWDRTSGNDGGIANASLNGGTTAFSVATDTASLNVKPINDPPVATPGYAYVYNNAPTILWILANANAGPADENQALTLNKINGKAITVGGKVATAHGSVTLNADSTITFTAAAEYIGTETITYQISDTGTPVLSTTGTLTLTVLPPSAASDSSLSLYDLNGGAHNGRQFRLIFTPAADASSNYRLATSNPGRQFYNLFYIGAPGPHQLTVTIPYPFVTHGDSPVSAYDGVAVTTGTGGQPRFVAGRLLAVDNWKLTLNDYDSNNDQVADQTSHRLTFSVTVPESGFLYLTIALNYGLNGAGPYAEGTRNNTGNAMKPGTTTVMIPDGGVYPFSFAVDGATKNEAPVKSVNEFKRQPGFAGLVLEDIACGADPMSGRRVQILTSTGTLLTTATTDEDGWYSYNYKHKAKTATYTIKLLKTDGVTVAQTKTITVLANGSAEVNFTEACP